MTTPDKEEMPTEDRTAGPWRLSLVSDAITQEIWSDTVRPELFATCRGQRARANAAFIVTACNAYEPMREALSELLNATIEDCGDGSEFPDDDGGVALRGDGKESAVTFAIIRRSLAALKGVPQPAPQRSSPEFLAAHAKIDCDPIQELMRRMQAWASCPDSDGNALKPDAQIVPLETIAGAVDLVCKLKNATEDILVAAYKRGFQWCVENASFPEAAAYVGKAARDYADYTMHAPASEAGKLSTDTLGEV